MTRQHCGRRGAGSGVPGVPVGGGGPNPSRGETRIVVVVRGGGGGGGRGCIVVVVVLGGGDVVVVVGGGTTTVVVVVSIGTPASWKATTSTAGEPFVIEMERHADTARPAGANGSRFGAFAFGFRACAARLVARLSPAVGGTVATGACVSDAPVDVGEAATATLDGSSERESAIATAAMTTTTQLKTVAITWRCLRCRRRVSPTPVAYE